METYFVTKDAIVLSPPREVLVTLYPFLPSVWFVALVALTSFSVITAIFYFQKRRGRYKLTESYE